MSKCQTRGAYGARGARNPTNAPVTRLFYESYMWRVRANISAPVDDPTAEPPALRDIQILFIKGVTPSIIARRGREEEGRSGYFSRRCRGFISFLTSNLPSPCQAVLLHPRGPDRHPAITPSHDPKLFFHIPPTRSSQSSQFSGKDQREQGRDKKTEIVRKRRARP